MPTPPPACRWVVAVAAAAGLAGCSGSASDWTVLRNVGDAPLYYRRALLLQDSPQSVILPVPSRRWVEERALGPGEEVRYAESGPRYFYVATRRAYPCEGSVLFELYQVEATIEPSADGAAVRCAGMPEKSLWNYRGGLFDPADAGKWKWSGDK